MHTVVSASFISAVIQLSRPELKYKRLLGKPAGLITMMTCKWDFNAVLQQAGQLTVVYIKGTSRRKADCLNSVSKEVERTSFAPLVLAACNRWNGQSICHLLQEVITTPCEHQTPSLQHHRGVAQFCTELRSAKTSTALCIPGCWTRDHTRARWGFVQVNKN